MDSDSNLTFSSGNLTYPLPLLNTINPTPLDDMISKISNDTFKLKASNFRVEITVNISYATL